MIQAVLYCTVGVLHTNTALGTHVGHFLRLLPPFGLTLDFGEATGLALASAFTFLAAAFATPFARAFGEAAPLPRALDEAAALPRALGEAAALPRALGEAAALPRALGEAAALPRALGEAAALPRAFGEALPRAFGLGVDFAAEIRKESQEVLADPA